MLLKQFSKYFSVGVLNTLIHWVAFLLAHFIFELTQSVSNIISFTIAVTFSFFMNAKFTFGKTVSIKKFFNYTIFMGGLSYFIGHIADMLSLPAIFTLIGFSMISLICGFIYSKFIVFRG
ncbi:GtrA family protein [Actinobacillus equuli subsp. haemolyticus]|uniref:GtrA family protein n=1 Tax=Actinobacillus equuli TaxID=718 RepID=UPI002441A54C|nr:GtrA family protein [Actinobacillus equuli]WGE63109.1 GtrA family protein [Actinobacillus equuli subsp. haemolyticus]